MADAWWNTELYSHGLLVAPICLWLFFKFRNRLIATDHGSPVIGLSMLVVAAAIWALGRALDAKVMMNLSVVSQVCALGVLIFGLQTVWRAKFAFIFLFFMVPFGEFLEPVLMEHTAAVTVNLLRWSGIPVFREGMQFRLPTGSWSVIEACSGLRYIIAALILSTLFAYLRGMRLKMTIGFVLLSVLVAILANWIRAYTVVLVGHFSQMKYGTGDDHVWYGWVFFGVVMMGVFWLGQHFGTSEAYDSALDNPSRSLSGKALPRLELGCLFASILLLLLVPLIGGKLAAEVPRTSFFPTDAINLGTRIESTAYEPHFTNPVEKVTFRRGELNNSIDSHFFYYAAQSSRQSKLIGQGHGITKPAETSPWKVIYFGRNLAVTGQVAVEALVDGAGGKRLVWSWYQVGQHQVSSPYKALAFTALNLVMGKGDHAVAVVMSTSVSDGEDAARSRLTSQYVESKDRKSVV